MLWYEKNKVDLSNVLKKDFWFTQETDEIIWPTGWFTHVPRKIGLLDQMNFSLSIFLSAVTFVNDLAYFTKAIRLMCAAFLKE